MEWSTPIEDTNWFYVGYSEERKSNVPGARRATLGEADA